ncbi:OpgC domain-containing protein [Novosphingobium panipatense]|uniref:OpgC domain-containing protein n=1 Tax=Novosphingobium TaxID=165696 RepID=UPI000CDA272A|nr:OpgC domain-containing protein [Novosphingobium sp. HII-3]
MPPGGKIPGLDIARTVAIVLGMLNHSFIATNVWRDFFEGKPHVAFAVRLATPMFIILFGALLEIVYRRRAVRDGMQSVTARLFERGLLCWLLYALTLLPLLLLGKTSVKSALFGALLLGKIPLTDILRYYAILFFMAPLLLVVRQRWGLYPLLATTTLLLLAHPLFVLLPAPDPEFAHYAPARMADLILGIGDAVTGPSVLHSLFFVALGMLIGRILNEERSGEIVARRAATGRFVVLAAALGLGALATALMGPERVTAQSAAGMVLRNANHPFYFFAGACGATSIIALCRLVRHEGSWTQRATIPGRRSLFAFSAGNAFLICVTWDYGFDIPGRLALSGVFFLTVIVLTALYDILMRPTARTSSNRLVRVASRCWAAIADPVNQRLRTAALGLTALLWHAPVLSKRAEASGGQCL